MVHESQNADTELAVSPHLTHKSLASLRSPSLLHPGWTALVPAFSNPQHLHVFMPPPPGSPMYGESLTHDAHLGVKRCFGFLPHPDTDVRAFPPVPLLAASGVLARRVWQPAPEGAATIEALSHADCPQDSHGMGNQNHRCRSKSPLRDMGLLSHLTHEPESRLRYPSCRHSWCSNVVGSAPSCPQYLQSVIWSS